MESPGEQMLADEAATTLIGLMASASWPQARAPLAAFVARYDTEADDQEAAEAELEAASEEVALARAIGDEATVAEAREDWRHFFHAVLCEHDDAGDDLHGLLAQAGPWATLDGGVTYELGRSGARIHEGIRFQVPATRTETAVPTPDARGRDAADGAPFVGRAAELGVLDGLAGSREPDAPPAIVVVYGSAGVGKSALVRHWAYHRSVNLFTERLYLDLAVGSGDPAPDTSEALVMCLRSLGVSDEVMPSSPPALVALYAQVTRKHRILVIADGVTDPAQVAALVAHGPGSVLLAISRRRMPSLSRHGAEQFPLAPLTPEESMELISARCGPGRITAARPAAEYLVEQCAGLPLALDLLARAGSDLQLLAANLEDKRATQRRFAEAFARDPADERTTAICVDVAYGQLDADTAHFYRLLGWLPARTFDRAVAAVATDTDSATTASHLQVLERGGFIERLDDGRYRMPDPVRRNAWESAVTCENDVEEVRAAERVATHYLLLTAFADRALHPHRVRVADLSPLLSRVPDPFEARGGIDPLEWLDAERHNIHAVLRTARRHGLNSVAWPLAECFSALFSLRPYHVRWADVLEQGAQAAAYLFADGAEAWLRSRRSRPLLEQGDGEAAWSELQKARTLSEEADAPLLAAFVQEHVAHCTLRVEPVGAAVPAWARCADLYTEAKDLHAAALAHYQLGRAHAAQGAHRQALEIFRQAHAELTDLDDPQTAARVLTAIGTAHGRLRETGLALRALGETARLLREYGDALGEAEALEALAGIMEQTGHAGRDGVVRRWRQLLAPVSTP